MTDPTVSELKEQLETIEASGRSTGTLRAQLDEVVEAIDELLSALPALRARPARLAPDDHAYYVEYEL